MKFTQKITDKQKKKKYQRHFVKDASLLYFKLCQWVAECMTLPCFLKATVLIRF